MKNYWLISFFSRFIKFIILIEIVVFLIVTFILTVWPNFNFFVVKYILLFLTIFTITHWCYTSNLFLLILHHSHLIGLIWALRVYFNRISLLTFFLRFRWLFVFKSVETFWFNLILWIQIKYVFSICLLYYWVQSEFRRVNLWFIPVFIFNWWLGYWYFFLFVLMFNTKSTSYIVPITFDNIILHLR